MVNSFINIFWKLMDFKYKEISLHYSTSDSEYFNGDVFNEPIKRNQNFLRIYGMNQTWVIQEKEKKNLKTCTIFLTFFKKIFLECGAFLKSLLNLSQHCFCFMFGCLGHEACGILAPRPRVEPTPPALEGEVLTSRLPGRSLYLLLLWC